MPKTPAPKSKLIRKTWPRIRTAYVRGQMLYCVDARRLVEGVSVGKRKYFATEALARDYAGKLAETKDHSSVETQRFPEALRVEAQRCVELLAPYGASLTEAAQHFIDAHNNAERIRTGRTFRQLVTDFLQERELKAKRGELRPATFEDLRWRCNQYAARFGETPVEAITRQDVRAYLESFPEQSGQSKRNRRQRLFQVFNFALNEGWVGANPVTGVKVSVEAQETAVLSVPECKALLHQMSQAHFDRWLPYVAVLMFAGLRPGEAQSLDWAQVDFKTGHIHVLPSTSKTGKHGSRYVDIYPVLSAWLKPFAQASGPVLDRTNYAHWLTMARDLAGLKDVWKADILRHTFASYWLPMHHSKAQLANLMGNSEAVINRHYRRPIQVSEARAFWKLTPPRDLGKQGVVLVG